MASVAANIGERRYPEPVMTAISTPPLRVWAIIASDIKIAHSVFALPFALLGAFMAATSVSLDWSRFSLQLGLIVLAMVLARTVAMLANRVLDARIDQRNPRTATRAIPSGRLSRGAAIAAIALCAAGFICTCAAFGIFFQNWWPVALAAPVLMWISAYALLKRFSWLCHIYLGSSLAISPLAAALAIQPGSLVQPSLWLLSAMVLCWVAGFDIIYALQDVEVDREQNLHSMPARLGITSAMWISRILHVVAIVCLIACWWLDDRFQALFAAGVIIVAALLIYEHLTVRRWGTTKLALAFFGLNGVISCVLGTLGILDLLF
jgi:4-hydroxybenzoate polyprenyltransferase